MPRYPTKKIIRNENWDYSWDGVYFITICTKDNSNEFGFIQKGNMYLNEKGRIVNSFWYEIETHFANVLIDQFIIMPNHLHGIIILDKINAPIIKSQNKDGKNPMMVGQGHALDLPSLERSHYEKFEPRETKIHLLKELPFQKPDYGKNFKPERFQTIGQNSISTIIGSFKSSVSRACNKKALSFKWQSRFYDKILMDLDAYLKVKSYIQNNPKQWKEDRFNVRFD